jgi:NADPH:quinone reductase-like Zn-dependent oxidoreductase
VVEESGPGGENLGLPVGSEVVVNPGVSCMRCEFCLRGQHSECASFRILGFQLEGLYAEFAVVPAANLFPKPKRLSWEEAAAMPLAHLTAWRMLFTRAALQPGETVLIHGIGGGVALAALQLCVLAGANAIVTSSSDSKLAKARSLGALAGFNYRTHRDIAAAVRAATGGRGVDVAFDNAGAPTLPISMATVRRGGRIVTCGVTGGAEAQINVQQLYWNHISYLGSTMGSMDDMRRLVRTADTHGLTPVVDKIFPLQEAAAALQRMSAGEQMGKIVLTV